jgi:hypothetical protein
MLYWLLYIKDASENALCYQPLNYFEYSHFDCARIAYCTQH